MTNPMTPDYRRIHELEYELGFRDDAPPMPMPTDQPGAVIYYNPATGRPLWDDSDGMYCSVNPYAHFAKRYFGLG